MAPWIECPRLRINLDKPMRLRFDDTPAGAIADGKKLLAAILADVPRRVRLAATWATLRTTGRFRAEMVNIARICGVNWRDVALANLSYDLVIAHLGCSTIALAGPTGPVLARNMDWRPEDILAQTSYVLEYQRRGETVFSSAGFPGAVGMVSALSQRGFAVVINAVRGPEKVSLLGYPVLLHLRRVVEDATSFDTALDRLAHTRLTVPVLFTLVGTQNHQRVVVERSPTRFALRWPIGIEPLITTNDYRLLFAPEAHAEMEIYQSTCYRFQTLTEMYHERDPRQRLTDEALLYALTDERVRQSITAQHVIIRPRENTLRMWVPRHLVTQQVETKQAISLTPQRG